MKQQIIGAEHWTNRLFERCGSYQWAREFLKNSLEAQATRVEFGIEWQAVATKGVYRRKISDNGTGMSSEDLLDFFRSLGAGAKKIGGVHDNFGVGAKIASQPWNPEGVVIVSYKDGQASMIWIMLDPDTREYELVDFEVDGSKNTVIDPTQIGTVDGVDWAALRPEWLEGHGTIVVLLGSQEYPDTVLGNPHAGEGTTKGLSTYLNTRFWDLSNIDVRVVELRSEKKAQWPQSEDERDNARRPNNRRIQGARYYLTDVEAKQAKLEAHDKMLLDSDRVVAEWYLWSGTRPQIHMYARENGYVAVRYKGELFELTYSKPHFRWFGIIEGKVQQNLTIILEPDLYEPSNGRWGVHPDQSRTRLIFSGNGEKGAGLPLSDWGTEFADNLPTPILEAIRAARGELTGSIDDDEYRKRLQDKFGNRWTVKAMVNAKAPDRDGTPGLETDQAIDVIEYPEHGREREIIPRRRRKTIKVVSKRAELGDTGIAVERDVPVDVPRYSFAHSTSFEQPWHLACWAPNDPDGPTVELNIDSPILQEIVEYHQKQYPDVYAEEVADTVRKVFGEVAACKIAHSQKLARHLSTEQLNLEYRSEQALTLALMGLMAEESVIAPRLGRMGRKRTPAAIASEAQV
jgi:hypothetical protein